MSNAIVPEIGKFTSRNELKKVKRLGDKAFEQAAGFLRIRNAKNPLDASAVHPERYEMVEKMAKDIGAKVADLMTSEEFRSKIILKNYVSETVGLPTLQDIMAELSKPGRDPRESFEVFNFQDGVNEMKELTEKLVPLLSKANFFVESISPAAIQLWFYALSYNNFSLLNVGSELQDNNIELTY